MIHQRHAKKQLGLLHIVFTAGSWPMVYHTATLIVLRLGLLFPSLGAKTTTPIIIYTSCYFVSSLCMRRRNTLIFILLLSLLFFFHYFLRNWRSSGPAALSGSLPVVSLEPSFHKLYLNWSLSQWTDIPAQTPIPAENVSGGPTESVFCEQAILKSTGKNGNQFFPLQ